MISTFDPVTQLKAICPTYGQECAGALFQRSLIAEKDVKQVAEVIGRFFGAAEPAAAELSKLCLITHLNQAAVSEFIKRVVRRFLLKANGLSGDELGRILGVDRVLARRLMKGTRSLTPEHIKLLVARLIVSADTPSCEGPLTGAVVRR
jgi:antitoxin component HigA of HigAB toxin-antitoxin module